MSAIYSNFDSSNYEDNCSVCWDSLKDTHAIAHDRGGELHPIHRDCARLSARVNNLCPYCRIETDTRALVLEDKCISILKPIPKFLCFGAAIGVIVAAAIVPALSQFESAALASAGVAGILCGAVGYRVEPLEAHKIAKTVAGLALIGLFTAGRSVAGGIAVGTAAVLLANKAGVSLARIAGVAIEKDAQVRTANIAITATLIFITTLSEYNLSSS